MNAHNLLLIPLKDGRRWRLATDYERIVDGRRWVIKKGFITNFASVPRFFWRIFPPWDKYGPASIIHDYIYGNPYIRISRKKADEIMYTIMLEDGVSHWKCVAIYYALRWFGFFHYLRRAHSIKNNFSGK